MATKKPAVQTTAPAKRFKARLFDPWTASLDAAREAQAGIGQGASATHAACMPLVQWDAVRRVENARVAVECGDGFAVLEAIAACVAHGLVAPEWLASAFVGRYRAVQGLRADSWDAEIAFGRPYPKGAQLARLRARRKARLKLANLVQAHVAKNPDLPMSVEQWEDIGRAANVGKTLAQELYSEAVSLGLAKPIAELRATYNGNGQPAKRRKVAGGDKQAG